MKRRDVLKGAGVLASAQFINTQSAQAQFLIGQFSGGQPPTPSFVVVTQGVSQAALQVLKPAEALVATEISGGLGVGGIASGNNYDLVLNGNNIDSRGGLDISTPAGAAFATTRLACIDGHWHTVFQASPVNAAGEVVTVIQVDAAGATYTPMTLAQAKALAPKLFVDFAPGQRSFLCASSWNLAIPYPIKTYTPLTWPASTGSNYGVAWASNSPGVNITTSANQAVTVTGVGTVNIHLGAGITGASGDGSIIVIDDTTVHNFLGFNRTALSTATATSYGSCDAVLDNGWGVAPSTPTGVTAVGSSQLAGLLIQAETDQGELKHALHLMLAASLALSGFTGEAISSDGSSGTGIVQEGQLLGIPPTTTMPATLTPVGQKVFNCLVKYGCYVTGKTTSVTQLQADPNSYDSGTIASLVLDMPAVLRLLQKVT